MNELSIAAVAAALLVALAGCKTPGPVENALTELGEYKDEICACPKRDCVFQVEAAHTVPPGQSGPSWPDRREQRVTKEGSPEDKKKLAAIKDALSKCLADLAAREAAKGGW